MKRKMSHTKIFNLLIIASIPESALNNQSLIIGPNGFRGSRCASVDAQQSINQSILNQPILMYYQ